MRLLLEEAILRNGGDEQAFFRMCFMWKWKKDGDVWNDIAQWKLHAILPSYVQDFLRFKYDLPKA